MVEVKYIDGEFMVKGTFDWGVAGVCENKDFEKNDDSETCAIGIELDLDTLKNEKSYEDYYWIKPLKSAFEGKLDNLDGDAAASIMTDYYNDLENQAKELREQINNYFLFRLMENLNAVAYPFWETEGAVLEGYDEVDDDVYTKELDEEITEASNLIYKIEDENQPEQMKDFIVDMRALFKKHLPMFNLEGLLKTITCEYTYLEGACVSVQFSDDWGCEYFCGAYEKFEPDFTPTDWHNF